VQLTSREHDELVRTSRTPFRCVSFDGDAQERRLVVGRPPSFG
jgi:hypothetical protein